MKKSIQLKIFEQPENLILKVKKAVEKHGLNLTGDTEKGLINGLGIEAHYMLQEDILTVKILRKPLLLPWAIVEQQIKSLVCVKANNG
jgi:hypothetical protein